MSGFRISDLAALPRSHEEVILPAMECLPGPTYIATTRGGLSDGSRRGHEHGEDRAICYHRASGWQLFTSMIPARGRAGS